MNHSSTRKLRRILCLLLALLLTASLAGCKKNDDSGETAGDTNPAPVETQTAPPVQTQPETTEPETTAAPETTVPETTAPEETEPEKDTVMGTVTASELNIRKQPGTAYKSVGSYRKGDRVEILEIQGGWGRTDKGWISMDHVKLDGGAAEETEPEETEIESDGKTTVKGYCVITQNVLNLRAGPGTKYDDIGDVKRAERYAYYQKDGSWLRLKDGWVSASYVYIEGNTGEGAGKGTVIEADLNVRLGPGKDYEQIGGVKKGDKVKILAQVNGWGYTGEGWVSMAYIKMDETTVAGNTGSAVIKVNGLNIRKEPSKDSESLGSYNKGDKVEILEVKDGWGRTDKGWISMEYVSMVYETGTGTVTATSLNIRKEPDKDAEKVGYYEKGDKIEILEVKDGWGRTDKGWVSMGYVKMES